MTANQELVQPTPYPTLVRPSEKLPPGNAETVRFLQSELAPGGAKYEEFREIVPVTPLVELSAQALPQDLRRARQPRILVKCDNLMPGGAYKLRGATNNLLDVPVAERAQTAVVVASTGNHGNETTLASTALGFAGTHIYLPKGSSLAKVWGATENGANLHFLPDLKSSLVAAEVHGKTPGAHFVHPFDDLSVIAGQGTAMIETAEQVEELGLDADTSYTVMCGVGGGGNAAGNLVAAKTHLPGAKFGVVQAHGAHALVAKLRGKSFDPRTFSSACDGAAVLEPGKLALNILRKVGVDIKQVVTDAQIGEAIAVYARMGMLVEPAGALALAGTFKMLREGKAETDAVIVHASGGNVTPAKVHEFVSKAYQAGLLNSAEAAEALSRTHLERQQHGLDEVLARSTGSVALPGLRLFRGFAS